MHLRHEDLKKGGFVKGLRGAIAGIQSTNHVEQGLFAIGQTHDFQVQKGRHHRPTLVDLAILLFPGFFQNVGAHFGEGHFLSWVAAGRPNFPLQYRFEVSLLGHHAALDLGESGEVFGHALIEPEVLRHHRIRIVEVANALRVQA